ncbi:hypothetical protein BDV35DRAFT_388832 [Aspergillus flavus]|uniref:Uncharacterized protein n=1 Tax=Aspergillus flavus TaxID=5059 RepID=A0A5N6H871_ASPFL|nr:hypothetical protein BDV35DRAFT_388832 [Aspergillus flavus]
MPNTEEYASLMSEPRKASLRDQKKRTASQISQLSQFSTASSSVSDSLEQSFDTSGALIFSIDRNGLLSKILELTLLARRNCEKESLMMTFFERAYMEHTDGESYGGIIEAKKHSQKETSRNSAKLYSTGMSPKAGG